MKYKLIVAALLCGIVLCGCGKGSALCDCNEGCECREYCYCEPQNRCSLDCGCGTS